MNENLATMGDILAALDESLKNIGHEVNKCWARVAHLQEGLDLELKKQETAAKRGEEFVAQTVRTVDPLDAPEVTDRDKDGEFDLAATQRRNRIELDE